MLLYDIMILNILYKDLKECFPLDSKDLNKYIFFLNLTDSISLCNQVQSM